ncbi:hypothetical protein FIBSPDRAFT_960426 [Athelia psychrophila]|uniref:DUF6533 domain-containing protein n=1 Tax=Athelia psychrophila TaxID=1759441 RepID=A0A166CGM7_9AGAM|nr:hypothetical protein FIBSPDRAFT_960426 [Fibularhizoctonia sp. CBS 109695]
MTSLNPLEDSSTETDVFAHRLTNYFYLVCLTAYTYDWILSVSDEVEIASKRGLSWSLAIYFLSRISQLGNAINSAVINIIPQKNCELPITLGGPLELLPVVTTTLLFFLRARAVFLQSKYATVVFGILWLPVPVLNVLTVATLHVTFNPQTGFCAFADNKFPTPLNAAVLVFDTSVFLAISYRLAGNAATEGSWRSRLLSFFKGRGLYSLSRTLLHSGQLYYLASILLFFANLPIMLVPRVPESFRYIMVTEYISIVNIMACRVFRGAVLGHMINSTPDGLTTTRINAAFQSEPLTRSQHNVTP